MAEIINPYIAGAPVIEARMFFGREDVFQWIENNIAGQYADHILVIHGQRRVGKTSVLKQLGNRLPKRYIPVFFDLQGRTNTTLDRFLWWLAREIVRVLKQERDITVAPPERELFTQDSEYFENRFLPDLVPLLDEDSTLLLMFDEFDNLEGGEAREALAQPLIDHLRRMMGRPNLDFIFSIGSSGRKLENMQAAYTDFFKSALYKKISFLSRDEAHSLIVMPVQGVIEYEKDAVQRIYEIVSGHPYFMQLICHELFSRCQKTGSRVINCADIESVLDDVVERGTVNLKFVWDEASDLEKWSLASLVQLENKRGARDVAEFLTRQRVRFSQQTLDSALLHLHEKDVLTEDNRFVNSLLQLWLKRNRPIEQVRDELTETNSLANHYIEIGLELNSSGQYDKAIESFREASALEPDNIQAYVGMALGLRGRGMLDQAVLEFDKALNIDNEDISARSGLCETHLAIGDAALQKGEVSRARQSYERVLAINPEHTEASQRMAKIHRQRAEQALARGKDEDAAAAFQEALKFTPQDESLRAQFDAYIKERLTRTLSRLQERARKEQASENWEAAISALQHAISLAPDDENLQNRLKEVQAAQERSKLDALLARCDAAIQAASWSEAIGALHEYLAIRPDEGIEQRLTELRIQKRQDELNTMRLRAQGLAKSEKYDEALKLWQEIVARDPEDQKAASTEIARLQQLQELAGLYEQARRSMAEKDYRSATRLLKDIVARDESYKDVLELLMRVNARRSTSKWPLRRKQLLIVLGILAALILIYLEVGYTLSHLTSIFPTSQANGSASQPAIPAQVTAAVTPTPNGPIHAFGDPILAAIANKAPDYQDDFSDTNGGWPEAPNLDGNGHGYRDGAYFMSNWRVKMSVEGSCTGVDIPSSLVFSDFVLEMDGKFINGAQGTSAILFRQNDAAHYGADVSPTGMFEFHKNINGNHVPLPQTDAPIFSARPGNVANHLTLIARRNQIAFYVNGEPVSMLIDSSSNQGRISFAVCDGNPLEVEIDNLKIWDISGVSLDTSAGHIGAFADPILAAVAKRPPALDDDFSDAASGWPGGQTSNGDQSGYAGGAYSLTLNSLYRNPSGSNCMDLAPSVQPQFPDFVLEVDTQFISNNIGSLHVLFRDTSPGPPYYDHSSYFTGIFPDGTFFLHKNFNIDQVANQINIMEGPAAPPILPGTGKNHFTIVAQGTRMAVYANGKPLVLVNDESWQAGHIFLDLGGCNDSGKNIPLKVRFDNLKVWDITGLNP